MDNPSTPGSECSGLGVVPYKDSACSGFGVVLHKDSACSGFGVVLHKDLNGQDLELYCIRI